MTRSTSRNKEKKPISKAIYIKLGDYDPSDEYVVNYSDTKTLWLYCKLTENKIDVETLFQQIHNKLNKQDKLKSTKHSTRHETIYRHRP